MTLAKLNIEIEKNEFELYDCTVYWNGEVYAVNENYRAERFALEDAYLLARAAWADDRR